MIETSWQRPGRCQLGTCVEVAPWDGGAVAIRTADSVAGGDLPVLATADEWAAFVVAVKAGEYDHLVTTVEPVEPARTRHWLEVYPDVDQLSARLICEHPTACLSTAERDRASLGCTVTDWLENTSVPDLLHWPPGDHPVVGRLEVAAVWIGSGEDADLRLEPVPTGATSDG